MKQALAIAPTLEDQNRKLRVDNASLRAKVILREIWDAEKKALTKNVERLQRENNRLAAELKKYKDIVDGPKKAAEAEAKRIERETKEKAKQARLEAAEERKRNAELFKKSKGSKS